MKVLTPRRHVFGKEALILLILLLLCVSGKLVTNQNVSILETSRAPSAAHARYAAVLADKEARTLTSETIAEGT
jgi:hypothetical protein